MYLGIDLGTSSVKVILLDENQQIVAEASSPIAVARPFRLWSEQAPFDWWQATNLAMAELKDKYPAELALVKGIGLSGQMHGATLLDCDNNIIRPAILWNDGRCEAQCSTIEQTEKTSRSITGNIAMPGFTAPKLLWVKEHEPDNFKRIHKVLLPKDYLRFLITGDYASDMSDSSGTLWLDVKKRAWSEKMLAATGLDLSYMPTLYEGTDITGFVSEEVAKRWGINKSPVIAGAGDNAAGAAGIGVINPGEAFLSLGTSGVYFVANNQYQPNAESAVHTFCHCLPDTWHQMSVILSAASCLTWVTKLTGYTNEQSLLDTVEKLDFSKPCTVIFLPYLSGERTPYNNPHAKGTFFGLSQETDAAELGRAVLEGVAFAFADGQQALEAAGTIIAQVSVIGGGARSHLWGRIIASVLNTPLIYRKGAEVGPAIGAARLAMIGVSNRDAKEICHAGEIDHIIHPEPTMKTYYARQHKKYQLLYQSLKSYF
ncbi:MAG: xylulokinase [Gammaproteobacteria bacterium]|nr:xylulokinase [Gammaproteobacteria bacterium]